VCMSCRQEVYPNDRVMALKGNWHRGCLKCSDCNITLSVRMLESYENKPYCRAHRPNPRSTQVADSVAHKQARDAPKAPRREAGVRKDVRMTFMQKPGDSNPLTTKSVPPQGYVPRESAPAPAPAHRVQGVNKTERRTFYPNPPGGKAPVTPVSYGGQEQESYSYGQHQPTGHEEQSYDQGGHESYDQGGHDQGGQENYDQGGYEQQEQGGYEQEQGEYQHEQGGYEQGQEGYEEGYEQGQEGYEEGYEQGHEGQQHW